MGCSRCLKGSYALQLKRGSTQVIEEANALAQKNMGDAQMEFVEETRLQGLLDRACTMKGNIFFAGDLLCFGNRALDACVCQ
jgi:hypothetical protein